MGDRHETNRHQEIYRNKKRNTIDNTYMASIYIVYNMQRMYRNDVNLTITNYTTSQAAMVITTERMNIKGFRIKETGTIAKDNDEYG